MNAARISSIHFDNDSSNSERSLDAWRDWFHPMLDISANEGDQRRFYSATKVWDIGGILLSRSVACATHVTRGKLNISRTPIDHWVISYNRRGTTSIATDKALLEVPPATPFLWSLGDKSSSHRSDVDRIQLMVPRDMFRDVAPMFDARRGATLDTPLGKLLGDYMLFLESSLDTVPESDVARLAGAIRSMIAACIAPSGERMEIAAAQIEHGRRERVRRIIHLNLRSRTLSPAMLCKHAGISRSQLYRLFQNSGGVLHYIQRERQVLWMAFFALWYVLGLPWGL